MRMVFVRHGEPDYEKDCLTEIGKKQAEAAAERSREWPSCFCDAACCGLHCV